MSHFEMKNGERIKLFIEQILMVMAVVCLPREALFASEAVPRFPASINRAAISIVKPSKIFYGQDGEEALSPELIANFNVIKQSEKLFDTSQVIPMDMQPSDNSETVFSQVADRSVSTLMKSDAFRSSSLGRTTAQVEQKLKTEVVVGGNEPKSIQHKFKFSAQAFQASAQILYSGLTNAALRYKVTEHKLGLEISEHVAGDKDLVMSHTMTPEDRLSEISVRWNF